MSDVRPLPPRPSLEYERKQAKARFREMRLTDPTAKLADAQFAIAREYGFTSWPRLVRYFESLARQGASGPGHDTFSRDHYLQSVRGFLREFADRRDWTARCLCGYVPRYFGRQPAECWADTPTEAEVQLAIARQARVPSWDVLMELAAHVREREQWWVRTPTQLAEAAVRALDLPPLQALVAQYPELASTDEPQLARSYHLMRMALDAEATAGVEAARPLMEWLATLGFDRARELHRVLCTMFGRHEVDALLARGASPDYVMPNGIPVLEHALLAMWHPDAIDRLAAQARPRVALWISAGLGDIAGVQRLLDRQGRPLPAARAIRPHFNAVLSSAPPPHPEPSDDELLIEAMVIAVMNGREHIVEYLAARGVPINTPWWGGTLLGYAVGNAKPGMVRCLLRCGADPELKGWRPADTAREIARWRFVDSIPRSDDAREVAIMMGWDPDALLAERRATVTQPPLDDRATKALLVASHDARRRRARSVQPLDLFFVLARTFLGNLLVHHGRLDRERFAAAFGARLQATAPSDAEMMPLHPRLQRTIVAAQAYVYADARTAVHQQHLFALLLDDPQVAALLRAYGADVELVKPQLARM